MYTKAKLRIRVTYRVFGIHRPIDSESLRIGVGVAAYLVNTFEVSYAK